MNLKDGVASLLEIESGSNDPTAYMLTVVGISLVNGENLSTVPYAIFAQIVYGVAIGVVLAVFGIWVLTKTRVVTNGMYTVHGNDGICEVKDITQLELPGGSSKRQYYLLVPQKEKNGRIYSPVESSKVQTRKVITKQEADTLIREIPAIQAAWVENEKLRENVYKEAIKSCDLRELVKIIKNMYLRRQERISSGKKATVLDDRYFKLAEDKLYSELVFVTGKDRNQIEKQIEQQAAQCMESV